MVHMLSKEKEFRIRAKRFFLTYPQLPSDISDLEEQAVINYERIFDVGRSGFKYVICKELHDDGNPHLHVYLEFDIVQKIYSSTKLDLILGEDETQYHGNYQSVKSQHGTMKYIVKSAPSFDSVVTNMMLPYYCGVYYSTCEEHLHQVLVNEGLAKARSVLFEHYPKEAIRRGSTLLGNLVNMSTYLRQIKVRANTKIYDLNEFDIVWDVVWDWIEDPRCGTLVFYGPSGTGKTELAKSVLNSMGLNYIVVGDKNSLKHLDLSIHQAILFDDMNLEPIAREEFIALLDTANGGDIRILYNVVNIPGDVARIFTTNRPGELFRYDPAIERRAIPVEVIEPVWKLPGGEKPKLLKDKTYVSYKIGSVEVHPALQNISISPPIDKEGDRVVTFESLESATPSIDEGSDPMVTPESLKSTTSLKLIEAGVKKKRRGRPQKHFVVDTTLVVKKRGILSSKM